MLCILPEFLSDRICGMDSCLPDWNCEVGPDFALPVHRKTPGLDNELVELLWHNGEIVLQTQSNKKQKSTTRATDNPNTLIQEEETVSWIDCPIDESFEKEFCANFLSEIPQLDPSRKAGGGSEIDPVGPSPQRQDLAPPPPPPRFQICDAAQIAANRPGERSVMTIGSSHCASNQVDMSWASSCGFGSRNMSDTYAPKVNEREALEQAITSCSGGSGSSLWKTSSQSNDTNTYKRKSRDVEESECPSDATELESAAGNKTSQKSGGSRRTSRVAEVHNMSERRRRDRINEKMKALQELIPHSNKSDKASMLDEAIEYMKSLQLQIQLMWMGRGMAPMMLPGMQHYMSRVGMGMGPAMLPAIQNLMRLSRLPAQNQAPVGHSPMMNPVNYQNQMQNPNFPEQYANYMAFHSMSNAPQQTNMFGFGFHPAQQKEALPQQSNGNAPIQ